MLFAEQTRFQVYLPPFPLWSNTLSMGAQLNTPKEELGGGNPPPLTLAMAAASPPPRKEQKDASVYVKFIICLLYGGCSFSMAMVRGAEASKSSPCHRSIERQPCI